MTDPTGGSQQAAQRAGCGAGKRQQHPVEGMHGRRWNLNVEGRTGVPFAKSERELRLSESLFGFNLPQGELRKMIICIFLTILFLIIRKYFKHF